MSHHSLEWDNASFEPNGEEDRLGFMLTTQLVLYDSDDDDKSEEYVKIKRSTANWVNNFLKVPGPPAYDVSDEENDGEVSQYDDEYEESEDEEETFYKQLYKDIDEDMIEDFDNFIRVPGETIATYISRLEERLDLYLTAKPWLKEDIKTVNVWNKFHSYVLNPELRELCIKKKLGPDQLSSAIQLAQNYYTTSNHRVWGNAPVKSNDESWASLTEKEITKNNSNKSRKQKTKTNSTINSDPNGNDGNDKLNTNTDNYTESTSRGKRGSARGRSNYKTNYHTPQTSNPDVPKGFANRLDFTGRGRGQNIRRGGRRGATAKYSSTVGHGNGIHSRLSYSDTGINRHSFRRQYGFNRGSQRQAERATEPGLFGRGHINNARARDGQGWTEEARQQGSFEFEQRNHFRGREDNWWAEESIHHGPSGRGRKYNTQDRNRNMWVDEAQHRGPSNRGRGNNSRGRNRHAWYEEANLPDPLGYRHDNNTHGRYGHIWAEEKMQPGLSESGRGYNSQSLDCYRWSKEAMQPGLSEYECRNNAQSRDVYKWAKEAMQQGPREYGYKNHGHRRAEESRQQEPSEYRQRNNPQGRDSYGLAEWTMQLGPSQRGRRNNTHGRDVHRWTEEDIQHSPSEHRHHNRSRGRGRGRGSTTVHNIPTPKKQCYWCKEENHKSNKCPVFEKVQEHIHKKNRNSSFSETS